jgi:hypothetical protein
MQGAHTHIDSRQHQILCPDSEPFLQQIQDDRIIDIGRRVENNKI